jgi:hypothetical protein
MAEIGVFPAHETCQIIAAQAIMHCLRRKAPFSAKMIKELLLLMNL